MNNQALPQGQAQASGPGPESGLSACTSRVSRNLAEHDVFLNYHERSHDVKNFVSHLDAALRRADLNPFLDAEKLVNEGHAFNSINDALTGVQVHVAVFSPEYAESEYCLKELLDMLASGKPLIPVFYNVKPEDVQEPEFYDGVYDKALSEWRVERGRYQDVKRWKDALSKAGGYTGFESAHYTDEAKLVDDIVEAVRVSSNLAHFDVFLNHHGRDVKRTFASHLDAALRRADIDPFLDRKSLEKGHGASNSMDVALKGAQVHVAVFSPNYATSLYCLNELFDMIESGKPLIPVLYNVDLEDLQCQNPKLSPCGEFAKLFSMWENHLLNIKKSREYQEVVEEAVLEPSKEELTMLQMGIGPSTVEGWKGALMKVGALMKAGAITGFESAKYTNEAKLVDDIVQAVRNALTAAP